MWGEESLNSLDLNHLLEVGLRSFPRRDGWTHDRQNRSGAGASGRRKCHLMTILAMTRRTWLLRLVAFLHLPSFILKCLVFKPILFRIIEEMMSAKIL